MSHPKALEAMIGYLNRALSNCQIEKGWPVYETYDDAISRFTDEVLKTKRQWLNSLNIYLIFFNNIATALRDRYSEEPEVTGPLPNLLNKEVDKIAEKILDLIKSIPRTYVIRIPLPAATGLGAQKIAITEDIWLIETVDKGKIPGAYEGYKLEKLLNKPKEVEIDKSYLCIASSGYAGTSIEDSAFQYAMSKFKQFVYLGISFKFLEELKPALSWTPFFGDWERVPHLEASALNPHDPGSTEGKAELSRDVAERIHRISINRDIIGSGGESVKIFLRDKFSQVINLLNRKEDDRYCSPIKSAVEWAFDAMINENESVSFIQICIGLEAILGIGISEGLRHTLADRCAYLLGTNVEARNSIKESFKQMYDIRSKIVHGRAVRLNDVEKKYFVWSKRILDNVIRKELGYLKVLKS